MVASFETCYRHDGRRAGVRCQRCGRPICPDCMLQASVGFQCPECVRAYQRQSPDVAPPWTRRPLVTISLIVANVAVYVLGVLIAAGDAMSTSSNPLGEQGGLIGMGSIRTGGGVEVIGVADGEWYRIFTSAFLHAGALHLGMNMFVLWILGSQLEPRLGRVRFLALYVTSLLAGALGVLLVEPGALTVGASGAVFGLMGAAFAAQRSQGIDPWSSGIGGLILLNMLFTFFAPGISVGGHLGGLLGGALVGFVMFRLEERSRSDVPAVAACAALSVVFFVAALWAAEQWRDPVLDFFDFV